MDARIDEIVLNLSHKKQTDVTRIDVVRTMPCWTILRMSFIYFRSFVSPVQ